MLVLNPATGHVSPQFHVVINDEFSTVPFIREGTITSNWTDIVQSISQSGAPYNIDLKYTWFTQDIEEDPRKPPSHEPRVTPENINITITLLQSIPDVQESPSS